MEREFKSMIHLLHKELADITFPTTKDEIIHLVGCREIPISFNTTIKISELISSMKVEDFSCAAEFYCALLGSL